MNSRLRISGLIIRSHLQEHKCVLDSCRALEAEGFDVTYLPVKPNGLIDLDQLEAAMRPDTSLVSVMMVNNEIGVQQPVSEIGAMCRSLSKLKSTGVDR